MTVNKALKKIISQNGTEILGFPNKVQSMIMDYSSSHERDVQLFCLSCQKGLLIYGQRILILQDTNEISDIAIKAKEMLQKDAFMDERYAIESVNMLLSALGITVKISTDTSKTHSPDRLKNMSNSEILQADTYSIHLSDNNEIVFDRSLIQDLMAQEKKGSVSAMMSLGNCYFHGIAVTEDWIIAESYYRKALVHGDDNEKKEAENRINEIYNKRQNGF